MKERHLPKGAPLFWTHHGSVRRQHALHHMTGHHETSLCAYWNPLHMHMQGSRIIHAREKRLFWMGLFANLGAWAALSFFEIVRLKISE